MAERKNFKKTRIEEKDEFEKVTLDIRRVSKTVKGGRKMHFSALVVVGDKKGRVGMGIAKAAEVPAAVEKATKSAKKNLIFVPIVEGTVPYETTGKFATSQIIIIPSKQGSGIIAGGAARSVFELAGYKDVCSKIHGSTNKINVVRATLKALKEMRSAEQIAMLRGKSVEEITGGHNGKKHA
ncbi:MAG: 30S ribosomal protein S5 [Clostridia bacterium]|nr:30S ribosomal protein S5 [Clostridia bacterium]